MDQASNLRNIIKNNQVNMIDTSSRVITVTSGKGGVGKSNISVNLALNFRRKGKRVIIFDADFGLANIEVIFGVVPKYNLFDMIYNNMELEDILTPGPFGIEFVSGGSGINELAKLSKEEISHLIYKLGELDKLADIIMIDTGAGISDAVLDFISASKEVILVTTPEPTSITDAYATLKAMNARNEDLSKKDIKLLVNKVDSDTEGLEIYNKLNKVSSKFLNVDLNNIGFLPYDKSVEKAVIEQKPVAILYPNSNIAKGFEKIADNIINNVSYEKKGQSGLSSLFNSILRKRNVKGGILGD